MAQQEEPLYDFPEPTQRSEHKFTGHQRKQGSLRNISILDRLLLSLPVWLQLSINPATALHILQREPPGTFLVRKSRTSRRNVLCVRLADNSVPSFVQQFGIREEHSTLSLETSAISFPDLPRLIAFYCVSRDVLPFPLELPEAIAKATSHKELESISHMGIEFWSSQLNVRGPRETPKACNDKEKKPDIIAGVQPGGSVSQPDSASQSDPANQASATPGPDRDAKQSKPNPTLFQEFCPIRTRSPKELNYGPGLGALCFINPLFLQSQNALHRRRMFTRSFKVRVSTETSSPLSPPLAPPPPPPLMPKTKGRCKAKARTQGQAGKGLSQSHNPGDPMSQDTEFQFATQPKAAQAQSQPLQSQLQMEEQGETQKDPGQSQTGAELQEPAAQSSTATTTTLTENLTDDSDYLQPSPSVNISLSPSLPPYLFPSLPSKASLSPFREVSPSVSPRDSPSVSPSLSPYQSPSPSVPFCLSPFTSPSFPEMVEDAYHTPTTPLRLDLKRKEGDDEERGASEEEEEEEDEEEENDDDETEEKMGLLLQQIVFHSLNETQSFSSLSSLEEEEADTPPPSPLLQDSGTSSSQS
ncbi:ras and Rab interactor 2-like [Myripristis murdjan]|uniref:ras and Rab interactor 2-like n=1 Tax=Myripristis murdjan TaxID=586833 RepID=UPI0011760EE4|nr:ras and Rab interactor 2-like [Myripristis murdjan]